MNSFDSKPLDEKIKTIKDESGKNNIRRWNEKLMIKSLLLLPLIVLISLLVLSSINNGIIQILLSLITPVLFISLGVLLYFRMLS